MALAFVTGIHRWLLNSSHKGLVKRKMFPFDNVIMLQLTSHELHGVSSHCQQVAEAQQRKHKSLALLAFRVSTGD